MKECKSGIYKITSILFPDRIYVGSAKNLRVRQQTHWNQLRKGNHINYIIQAHVKKYGLRDLSFSVIEYCSIDDLLNVEQFYLDGLNPSFNICRKAGNTLGRPWTERARQKRLENRPPNGYKLNEETRRRQHIAALIRYQPPKEVNFFELIAQGIIADKSGRIKHIYKCQICGSTKELNRLQVQSIKCECRKVYKLKQPKVLKGRPPVKYNIRRVDNTSGYPGVTWDSSAKLWRARIKRNGKLLDAGRYGSAYAAHKARQKRLRQLNLPIHK